MMVIMPQDCESVFVLVHSVPPSSALTPTLFHDTYDFSFI